MKIRKLYVCAIVVIMILLLFVTFNSTRKKESEQASKQELKQIYIYGEYHGVDKILDKEFELWDEYYHNQGMRHLFVELPYYTAEFLNIWMKSDSNDILDTIYNDWAGTAEQVPDVKEFYEKIKEKCPETVFHGTDVGHQHDSTGVRFLRYLNTYNLEDTEQYELTNEAIKQGKYYYSKSDNVYRENTMVENFIREYDKLSGESIMGIYGAAHIGLEDMDYVTKSVPCMANQLNKNYEGVIYSEDLSSLLTDSSSIPKVSDPERIDTISLDGKDYEAAYFGKHDISYFSEDYSYREFWRLENAYDDFKDRLLTNDVLPDSNYPMQIETGQIFVIDYTKPDGTVIRTYYRSDGDVWNNQQLTNEFTVE